MAPRSLAWLAIAVLGIARADNLEAAKAAIRLKDFESAAKLLSSDPAPSAKYLLGSLHLAGLGVPLDTEHARKLFESAAQQGEPRAAFALAGLFANETPRDLNLAQQWLNRAAELHFPPAVELKKRGALPLAFRPQSDLPDDNARREAFWLAAANDDVATLQSFDASKYVASADEFGRTALHRAAENGAGGSVAWLLTQHAAVDTTDRYDVTPLMLAAASKSTTALTALLDAKARVAAVDPAGNGALTYAARNDGVEQLKILLDAGATLSARNKNGWSAIDCALQADATQAVELLRARGAVAVRQAKIVAPKRSSEILRPPAKVADLYSGWSDLAIAVTRDDPTLVQEMLRRGARLEPSLLSIAAETQSPQSVSVLLANGAQPSTADARGRTPLTVAIEQGDAATMRALLGTVKVDAGIRTLLGTLKVDARTKDDASPLIAAIRSGHEPLVSELLKAGADANVSTQASSTLLLAAQRGQAQAVNELLSAHVSVDTVDAQGRSALWYAASAGHAGIVDALLRARAASDVGDRNRVTPLLEACARGRRDVVEQLLANGANARAKSEYGDTALILAASGGHVEIVQHLLATKRDFDVQNARGDTALIAASRGGHEQVVALLLQAGASSKLRNNEKIAAEDAARARGFERIATLIEKR